MLQSVANQSAWERGRKKQNPRKWLGEGAKGLLDPRHKGLPIVSCTMGNPALHRCKRLFAPSVQGPFVTFCTLTTFRDFPVFDPSPRHPDLQAECRKVVAKEVDAKVVAKLSRSCRRVVTELLQNCHRVCCNICRKVVAKCDFATILKVY